MTLSNDPELDRVITAIKSMDPTGDRISMVLRNTLDQLYDGQRTGRYRWDQLHKTEKTHCGTLVEINLHREFEFEDGNLMDYLIKGVEVDCKYSQAANGWMIPIEAMHHLCLLVTADDQSSLWSMGIVRIEEDRLTAGGNRDAKRSISATGRKYIRWIFTRHTLPPNILLQLPRKIVEEIMSLKSGQKRINAIFRIAQKQRIGRGVIATLGQQDDYMKRIRGNGGARTQLRPEGIIILGQYDEHKRIAGELGVPIPQRGESVSVRVCRASEVDKGVALIQGCIWRVANDSDPVMEAPDITHV